MERTPGANRDFGDTFASSLDSGHREIEDGIYLIEECILKSSVTTEKSERMLEWYDPTEGLHAAQNAYLVRGDENLLYDTLTPAGEETILQNLRAILGDEELDYLVISHPEANHAGNVGAIIEAYPDATLVVAEYGVHHELFDVGEDAMLVGDGDAIDLGSGRRVEFHEPTFFDHAMTVFMSEPDTGTVFTADWFGYEHMATDCLGFADEQDVAVECDTDVASGQFNRFQGYALLWFRYADTGKTDARIDRFAEELSPSVIAPAHGLPLRRDLDEHLELMKDVIGDISDAGPNYHTHTHGHILLDKELPTGREPTTGGDR